MKPSKWRSNPQHITRTFENVTISSRFDGGNLENIMKQSEVYDIFISQDQAPYSLEDNYRNWFQFCITGAQKGDYLTFRIANMKNQSKLYTQGLKPVYKVMTKAGKEVRKWERIPSIVKHSYNEEDNIFTVSFSIQFFYDSTHIVYVAYGFPFSLTEISGKLDQVQQKVALQKNVYCYRETLTYSLEGRKMEMMTLSSTDKMEQEQEEMIYDLFPEQGE